MTGEVCCNGSALGEGFCSTVTVFCGVFFLLLRSTTDPNGAITTAKAIAPTVPKLTNASTGLVCEVSEDEPDAMEGGRTTGVAVVLLGLTALLSRKAVTGVNWSWTPLGKVTKFGAAPWAKTCSA